MKCRPVFLTQLPPSLPWEAQPLSDSGQSRRRGETPWFPLCISISPLFLDYMWNPFQQAFLKTEWSRSCNSWHISVGWGGGGGCCHGAAGREKGGEKRPRKTMLKPAAGFSTLLRASPAYLQLGEYKHRPETGCLSPTATNSGPPSSVIYGLWCVLPSNMCTTLIHKRTISLKGSLMQVGRCLQVGQRRCLAISRWPCRASASSTKVML